MYKFSEIAAMAATPTPTPIATKKKKKPESTLPGYLYPAAGLGGLGLLGAYGMGSDQHYNFVKSKADLPDMPTSPTETEITRYVEKYSPAAQSTLFGNKVGKLLLLARSNPALLKMFKVDPKNAVNNPGLWAYGQSHYNAFDTGPIAAYHHMLHPAKFMNNPKLNVVQDAQPEQSYPDYMLPKFNKAFREFVDKELPGPEAKSLEPHDVTTAFIPHDKQMQFLRDFGTSLSPQDQAIRAERENSPITGLKSNINKYGPITKSVLDVRDKLKTLGVTAGGAALGGALTHYLQNASADKNKKRSPLTQSLTTLAGTGLGGAAGFFGGTEQGQNMVKNLLARLGSK